MPNTNLDITVKPSLNKEVKSVTAIYEGQKIEFKDTNNDGIYETNISAPSLKGSYTAKATILYADGAYEEITINLLVDPFGYVYEKNTKGEQRLANTKVTLYYQSSDGKWNVWNADDYKQTNPQTTQDNGEYGFMVPTGTYYLTAQKDGYVFYKSNIIQVKEGKPININIELTKENWFIKYWYYLLGLIIIIIIIVLITKRRRQGK